MKASSTTAQHLADLDAQHEAHLAALREQAALARAAAANDAAELAERLDPEPPSDRP